LIVVAVIVFALIVFVFIVPAFSVIVFRLVVVIPPVAVMVSTVVVGDVAALQLMLVADSVSVVIVSTLAVVVVIEPALAVVDAVTTTCAVKLVVVLMFLVVIEELSSIEEFTLSFPPDAIVTPAAEMLMPVVGAPPMYVVSAAVPITNWLLALASGAIVVPIKILLFPANVDIIYHENKQYLLYQICRSPRRGAKFANHRKELMDKSVSKNDAIFVFHCIGMQKMASFSLTGKIGAPPRRAAIL